MADICLYGLYAFVCCFIYASSWSKGHSGLLRPYNKAF